MATNFGNDAGDGTIVADGISTTSGGLSVTNAGIITMGAGGGVSTSGRSKYLTTGIGSTAYSSLGTNATPVAGTIYWAEMYIPRRVALTGAAFLNGGTVGTDKAILALYSSAGVLVANSALAGVTTVGANAFQEIAFTAPVTVPGPSRYWLAVQLNGTTTRLRTIAASTVIDCLTTSATGAFGTLTALTVPTTFTADVGPYGYVYV